MKPKEIFVLLVGLLNVYVFASWLYAFNKYAVQLIRVKAFREFFFGLDLNTISLSVAGLTIISLIVVIKLNNRLVKIALLTLHSITLLFLIWTNL